MITDASDRNVAGQVSQIPPLLNKVMWRLLKTDTLR